MRRVSSCNRLALCLFSTATAGPGHVVINSLGGRCRQDVLLIGRMFAAGCAAAFARAFFLLLYCTLVHPHSLGLLPAQLPYNLIKSVILNLSLGECCVAVVELSSPSEVIADTARR